MKTRLLASAGLLGICSLAVNACSSSSTKTPPPVNDAGPRDSSTVGPSDGGDSSAPPSDGGMSEGGPAPACNSLPGTIVYIESGDTQEVVLKNLGRTLRDEANITLVFQLTGSCTLSPDVYNAVPIPVNTSMLYIPSTKENAAWTASDPEATCSMAAATPPDLGIAALFPSSCPGLGSPPSTIGQWNGPIQAYTFVVPDAEYMNGQQSIAAEEAYYAFGFGAMNPVTVGGGPDNWTDPTQFFLRPTSKSTLVSIAIDIDLTPNQMAAAQGSDGGTADGRQLIASSGGVVTAVAAATSTHAIGILGVGVYDSNRSAGVKVLALQSFGQNHAYLPDSTATSYDKQNLRDGHYAMWSPAVFIAPQDSSGAPSNPTVKYVVDTILGTPGVTPPNGLDGGAPIDGLGPTALAGEVPACAMQVTRTGDGAPLTAYTPTAPCLCKFLSLTTNPTLPASCTTCTSTAMCPAGSLGCFNGYCESAPTPITDAGAGCDNTSILNACTNATAFDKANVVYPTAPDGGLEPPPL